jgi:hypothetical protein
MNWWARESTHPDCDWPLIGGHRPAENFEPSLFSFPLPSGNKKSLLTIGEHLHLQRNFTSLILKTTIR